MHFFIIVYIDPYIGASLCDQLYQVHMSFLCSFLDTHLTTYHSTQTCVQIIAMLDLGTSILHLILRWENLHGYPWFW